MASHFLGLDVGEKRIGVALADGSVKIAIPYVTIEVNGGEVKEIAELILRESVQILVVGYPRNQSGEATAQTAFVEAFTERLKDLAPKIVFQDESLTSVIAEERLQASGKPYQKGDIDAQAAAIILQDYLESH
jgi:putative Holliday junction resolvase